MTTLTEKISAAESFIAKEIPIVKKDTFNVINWLYKWGYNHPKSATAIIAFIVGFILGTLV